MRRIRIKENNKNNELTKEEVDESNDIELEKISKVNYLIHFIIFQQIFVHLF